MKLYVWTLVWTPWQTVGLAIFIPAFLLFVLARIELGRAFSIKAKASTLVTTGIYARIRNPIYVFGALMSVGIFIFAHHPWLLLIWVALDPAQVFRVGNGRSWRKRSATPIATTSDGRGSEAIGCLAEGCDAA